jgi:hypothetical protein
MYKHAFIGLVFLIITFVLLGVLAFHNIEKTKIWVATGSGDVELAYSVNGIEWTGVDGLFDGGSGNQVHANQGRWVVVGEDSSTEANNIWWSDDARNWFSADSSVSDFEGPFGDQGYGMSVYYGSKIWVATGDSDDGSIWWSTDRKLWTPVKNVDFSGGGSIVKYLGGIWLVGGIRDSDTDNILYYSEDGKNWKASSFPDNGTNAYINDFSYQDDIWLAGGSGQDNTVWYSTDKGKSWTGSDGIPFTTSGVSRKFQYYKGKWFVTGEGDQELVYSSEDGMTWDSINLPQIAGPSISGYQIAVLDGKLYAVGQINGEGGYIVSENGNDWKFITDEIIGSADFFSEAGFKDGLYVFGNENGDASLVYSDSATSGSWNIVSENPFGSTGSIESLIFG